MASPAATSTWSSPIQILPLALREVVNLLQSSLPLVGVGAFAGPRIELPHVEARPQAALVVKKGPYSNGATTLMDTLHSAGPRSSRFP